MSERDDRLLRCFASLFPTLSEEEIRASNVIPLIELDSLTGVTLVALIDQEFGVNVDVQDLLERGSFEAISQYVRKLNPSEVPHE